MLVVSLTATLAGGLTPVKHFFNYFNLFCCGTAKKPLHRLRGLYADDVAKLTEDAVLARLEGIKEASRALGHTTTKTTLNHYLSTTTTPRMQEP